MRRRVGRHRRASCRGSDANPSAPLKPWNVGIGGQGYIRGHSAWFGGSGRRAFSFSTIQVEHQPTHDTRHYAAQSDDESINHVIWSRNDLSHSPQVCGVTLTLILCV
jgi:hypothetical protein